MSAFTGHTFGPADVVSLDGNQFDGCTFEGCTVMYGGGPLQMTNCNWRAPKIVFVAHAQGTLNFIRSISRLNGGDAWVAEVVAYLRGADNEDLVPTVHPAARSGGAMD